VCCCEHAGEERKDLAGLVLFLCALFSLNTLLPSPLLSSPLLSSPLLSSPQGMDMISSSLTKVAAKAVAKGTVEDADSFVGDVMSRISATTDSSELADCDCKRQPGQD
jgi:hypothetical protein